MTPPAPFRPAAGLGNAHLQTLWAPLLRRPPRPPRRRERLELPDGDFVDCDWHTPSACDDDAPVVIVLHGLAGCSGSHYVLGIQQALGRRGWRSVALNFRGSTGDPNRLARGYHAGDSGDLERLHAHVAARYPGAPRAAIGYSLGGNVLLKWLGERAGDTPLVAACAVSVPLRLDLCTDRLDQGLSVFYRNYLLKILKKQMHEKIRHFEREKRREEQLSLERLGDWAGARTFREFDGRVIAPLHGFRDAEEYYARSSSAGWLARIAVPTLLVQARDDPFLPPAALPRRDELGAAVTLHVSEYGGHVGFVEGSLLRPGYWLERVLPDYLRARLVEVAS